jgi:hypothetical protein
MKSLNLDINERFNIKDKVSPDCGYVDILETGSNNLLVSQNNLITYSGRRWLMHKALNNLGSMSYTPGSEIDPLEGYMFYFGLGSGGTTIGNPLNSIAPAETDTDLAAAVPINDPKQDEQDGSPLYYTFAGGGYKKQISNIVFSDTNSSVTSDTELQVNLQCIVEDDEAVLPPTGTTYGNNISEAGIFISEKTNPLSFILFSRITFSTSVKDLSSNKRGFTINWHFLF